MDSWRSALCVWALLATSSSGAACGSDEPTERADDPVPVVVSVGEEDPLPPPPPRRLTPDEAQAMFITNRTRELPRATQVADPNAPRATGLEPASAHYRVLHARSFTQTPQPTIQDATAAMMQSIQEGVNDIVALDQACAGVAAQPACLTLRADARDLLGERVRGITMPFPQDLERQIQHLPAADQEQLRAEVAGRIREVLAARAADLFCQAMTLYRQAGTPRAEAQLRRYGSFNCP